MIIGHNLPEMIGIQNLDLIVSVFDKKYWPILYPKSIKKILKLSEVIQLILMIKNFMISKKIPFEKKERFCV